MHAHAIIHIRSAYENLSLQKKNSVWGYLICIDYFFYIKWICNTMWYVLDFIQGLWMAYRPCYGVAILVLIIKIFSGSSQTSWFEDILFLFRRSAYNCVACCLIVCDMKFPSDCYLYSSLQLYKYTGMNIEFVCADNSHYLFSLWISSILMKL